MALAEKDKIIAAAEKLKSEGINPTQGLVRTALGGGSFQDIGPALAEWKKSQIQNHALAEVRVPESVSERLEHLKGHLWNVAIDEAERRLSAEREALKEAQEKNAAEVAEANEAVGMLESEAEVLKREIFEANEDRQKVQLELSNYKDRLSKLREDTSQSLSEKTAKIESLSATVTELRGFLEKAEKRSESLESKLDQRQSQQQEEVATIRKDHKSEIDTIQANHREALATEAKRIESLEGQNKHLTTSNEQAHARREAAQNEIEQHRSATAKMREKLESAQQEAAELRGELKALREKKLEKDKG